MGNKCKVFLSGLHMTHNWWPTQVGKLKFVCVNDTITVGKRVVENRSCSCHQRFGNCCCVVHVRQLEFADLSLPIVCCMKAAVGCL